jgi:solute carrier family 25 protein 39/40
MITNPFDVAKTHRQMIMTGQVSASASGTPDIMRNIVRRHGWRGLFAGLGPRIAKVAPACGVMIGTYETAKQYFATRNRRGY